MAAGHSTRQSDLRHMLQQRRRDIMNGVVQGVREAAGETSLARAGEVRDMGDEGEAMLQEEVRFALLSMKSEMGLRIDRALQRLTEGGYGACVDCGEDIVESRLRAMPFAERCRRCQELHEDVEQQRIRRSRNRSWRVTELVNR
jgi:DnaK suppressor protein